MSWEQHAQCKGKTKLFFAPNGERPEAREVRIWKAKKLCLICPVQEPCREAGRGEPWGVWGGMDFEDRGFDKRGGGRRGLQTKFVDQYEEMR